MYYPPGHLFGDDSRSLDALIQNRAEASTSKNLAYSLALSARDSHQYFDDTPSDLFAQSAPGLTFCGTPVSIDGVSGCRGLLMLLLLQNQMALEPLYT